MKEELHNINELDQMLKDSDSIAKNQQRITQIVNDMHSADLSNFLEQLPRAERLEVWDSLEFEQQGRVLSELSEGVRSFFIENTNSENLARAASFLDSDDLAELIRKLPSELAEKVLSNFDREHQKTVGRILIYEADQAGALMNPELIKVQPDKKIKQVTAHLRKQKTLSSDQNVIFVTEGSHQKLIGVISLRELLLADPQSNITEVMDDTPISVRAEDSLEDAVRVFRERDLLAMPVVNAENVLLGQITVDDIVDLVDQKQAQYAFSSVGGLTKDEDLFLPVWQSTTQRALWLGINLLTAFLAAAVVSRFGLTIEKAVGLAVLMPIVASMGGIAGSQTMVLVIRGMALDLVNRENISQLINKELLVGLANGLIWSVLIAIMVLFWMNEFWLTVVILIALLINITVGTWTGVVLPLMLKKMGFDPAISANVILTTITDVIGLGVFLGSAGWYLNTL